MYSLSGSEAQAVDFYDRKKEPANQQIYLQGNNAEQIFNMNFGRRLWDPIFAFDPTKYKNPQLKITMVRGSGGNTSTVGALTVLANIFDEKMITPMGFLMNKEIKDYPFGVGTHEYTALPTDFPYRKMFIRSQVYGTGSEWCFTSIKLSEDNDKRIPLNHSIGDCLRSIVGLNPPYRERIVCAYGGGGLFYCTPAYWPKANANTWALENSAAVLTTWAGDGGRGYVYPSVGFSNMTIDVEGYCPHGVLEFPFGLQDDPDDWYDVTRVGSLKLDIVAGGGMSATENCQIFLQQARRY
ncbi:hypothetical protein ES707_22388 [subsurface metagenome]